MSFRHKGNSYPLTGFSLGTSPMLKRKTEAGQVLKLPVVQTEQRAAAVLQGKAQSSLWDNSLKLLG